MKQKSIVIVTISDLIQEANLYRKARTLANEGFDVRVLAVYHPRLDTELWQGIELHRLRLRGTSMMLRIPEFVLKSLLFLLRYKADLFISYDVYPLLPLRLKQLLHSAVYLYDSVELFLEVEALAGKTLRRRFWKWYEGFGIKGAAGAFTVCQSDARHLLKIYPFLKNVPYVRNIPEFKPKQRKRFLRDTYGIPEEVRIGIYQGQIYRGRGLEQLVAAMAAVEGMVLFIVGDGPLKESLREQALKIQGGEKVVFIDAVPFQELQRYTLSADVGFTLISGRALSYYHALPNKLFEYIQAGIPVIGSNYPEIEAVIRGEDIGYAVDPHSVEAIAGAIRDIIKEENYRRFRQRALSIREKYSWQKESERYLQIIRAVLHGSK